jgi:16S rRNA (uracil1498-N3)-methyltransferase
MKLQRFYVAREVPSKFSTEGVFEVVDEGLANQLKRVFRFHVGDSIIVFDGDGQDYECLIKEFLKDKVVLQINRSYPSRFMPDREIWLCVAIIKKNKFEWIAEKATELGVSHIIPIVSERSEKKSLNIERLEKIIIEASEQSGRGNVPTIYPIMKLNEAIEHIKHNGTSGTSEVPNQPREVIAFHTEGELFQGSTLDKGKPVALFIGPEGGWSEKEVDLFHEKGIPVKCLGKQILRAETAAIAALVPFVF